MEYIDEDHLLVRNKDHINLPDKDFGAEIIDKETVKFYENGVYIVLVSDNKITIHK